MFEQVLLIMALIGCLALVFRLLAPTKPGGCHAGDCGCETIPPESSGETPRIQPLIQLKPPGRK
jgi:hypothetical protein